MDSDTIRRGINYAVEKGAYLLAIAITIGFFWGFYELAGFEAVALLVGMFAVVALSKIFIIWFF